MSDLAYEIRVALRGLSRDKAFAVPVLLTLILCIAANAAVFTVVYSVLLHPLPLPAPDRLVWITNSYPKVGVIEAGNSPPDYYDRKQAVPAFAELALYRQTGRTLGVPEGAERATGMVATPSLFPMLRRQALRGRLLEERDGQPGQEHEVLLSFGLWQRLFGGREDAIGKDLRIDGVPHTVVGVMPRDFLFVDPEVSFWLPLALTAEDRKDVNRGNNYLQMVARLRPGATLAQARQQLHAIDAANLERFPQARQQQLDSGFLTVAMPLQEHLVHDVRGTLYLLWGGVICVLLIGCVNVTNLALVRSTTRSREMAARQTLGAGPWRLLRPLLMEGLLLASGAGILGTLLALAAVRALSTSGAGRLPRGSEISVGAPTLLLVVTLSLALCLLLALIPLAQSARSNLAQTLRTEGRGGTAGRRTRSLRRVLVAAQVAFAFVLLLTAGLLLASFQQLLRVRSGFDPGGVLTGKVSLPSAAYPKDGDLLAWSARALERIRALPGVTAAGFGDGVPLASNYSDNLILAEGYVAASGEPVMDPAENGVTPGYFAALGIPVIRGRAIDERDTPTSQLVLMVDQRLADKFWPGKDPIGRRVALGGGSPMQPLVTVVGVVPEVKQRGLASPEERIGAYYFSYTQHPFPYPQGPRRIVTLVARTSGNPLLLARAVRGALAAIDPQMPLYDVQTMESRLDRSVTVRRTAMRLAGGFGLVALILATLGLYGVLAYQVTQRTREIGIRMALGSESGRVFKLVLGEGAALLVIGLAVGMAGLSAVRRTLTSELYGVTPFDPAVLAAATLLLGLVALAACVVPARRAARIDPAAALAD
ncbi:MAG TPA: ABC transporter permease [Thermoanaerobaculia bacterium]|jgi:predicted permease|nr:ABC transporter permease [Thermoanaerobaculia bacterium]